MQIKNLLVAMDADAVGVSRLNFAAQLARANTAHMTGVFYFDPLVPEISAVAMEYCSVSDSSVMRNPDFDDLVLRSNQAKPLFEACLRRDGLNGEWHVADGVGPGLAQLARLNDLVIAGQPRVDQQRRYDERVLKCLLLESGRPVLVLPFHGGPLGALRSILVGWDGSQSAARALHDSMPLLKQAESVTILSVSDDRLPDTEIAASLDRHGIDVTAAQTSTRHGSISEALLNYAIDIGADLLVAGCYGHSPVHEKLFGGVTRGLLRNMTMPVLLSH